MKISIISSKVIQLPLVFDIDVYTDYPVFDNDSEFEISASKQDIRSKLPKGEVISKDRNKITQRMIDDYESFVERIEDLCEESYDLVGTYSDESNDYSHYYNYLVKDLSGNIIAKFRIRIRISNHSAKRTQQQQQNKRSELDSEKLHQLLTEQQISRIRSYPILIVVNNETFESYEEAFDSIDERIQRAIEVIRK